MKNKREANIVRDYKDIISEKNGEIANLQDELQNAENRIVELEDQLEDIKRNL